jgi:hypothetical protein
MKVYRCAAVLVLAALPADAALTVARGPSHDVSCNVGVCTATAADASLDARRLETMLADGNLTLESGSAALDIVIAAAISWTGSSTLKIAAYRSVTVAEPISIVGAGGLQLLTGGGGSGGVLLFQPNGHAIFSTLSSPLWIENQFYTLEGSVASLASAVAANPYGFYALANDYDAGADGTYSASPVSAELEGTFQGLGNTISRLKIDDLTEANYVGLFATLGQNGAINGLRLANASIKSKNSSYVGGILGGNGYGSLTDDSVSGSVHGTGNSEAGGVAGWTFSIADSSSSADVLVTHRNGAAGGLAGSVNVVDSSFATGNVTGAAGFNLGGLVGETDHGIIENSYATGAVTGGNFSAVGGLVGDPYQVETSYSTGAVLGAKSRDVGGLAGSGGHGFSDCYWDTTTSGTTNGVAGQNVAGVTGLTTSQFQSGLPADFDPTIWAESPDINGGFPYLIANPPPS